jgi:hypothetical protein
MLKVASERKKQKSEQESLEKAAIEAQSALLKAELTGEAHEYAIAESQTRLESSEQSSTPLPPMIHLLSRRWTTGRTVAVAFVFLVLIIIACGYPRNYGAVFQRATIVIDGLLIGFFAALVFIDRIRRRLN